MALLDFYGQTPDYYGGLLGTDELNRLRQQAQEQGTLNMATALLQAGAPSRTPGGGALAIAQGLQMGQDAYRKALNQGLQEKMTGLQVEDLMRKRQEEQAVRRFLPQIMQTTTTPEQLTMYGQPTQGVIRDDEGNLLPGGGMIPARQQTAINRQALQQLALAAPEQFAKISGSLKALQPEYKEAGGVLYEIPTYGGEVREVAGQRKEDLAGPVKQAMQVLGINKPFAEVTLQERTAIGQYIDRQESLKSPKVAVDLKDPTAIAKAQSTVLKDWTGVLESGKAGEVADRYLQAVSAVRQASAGSKTADGSLIYAVGKIYDPSGAVQEGDKTTIIGNRSIPESVQGVAQKYFSGKSLLPNERKQLLDGVQAIAEAKSRNLNRSRQPYIDLSKQMGGTGELLRNPIEEALSERKTLDDILGGKR